MRHPQLQPPLDAEYIIFLPLNYNNLIFGSILTDVNNDIVLLAMKFLWVD